MPRWVPLVVGFVGACRFGVCEDVTSQRLDLVPSRLSETGLFADVATDAVAADVIAFQPRFQLWSDGAEKRRWLLLPEGGVIDGADPDQWQFPVGTRVWKEFTRDGVRVETRMIERVDDDWVAVAYLWNADGTDAVAVPEGVEDASGTPHDVPTAEQCVACHGGRESFVLGFSAVQLTGVEGIDLASLVDGPLPTVEIPGDDVDQAALGYLHANCSHCHNEGRTDGNGDTCYTPGVPFDFGIPADPPNTVGAMPALQTAEGAIHPGHPKDSTVLNRISHRNKSLFAPSMPPLGTEEIDTQAVELLTEWVTAL